MAAGGGAGNWANRNWNTRSTGSGPPDGRENVHAVIWRLTQSRTSASTAVVVPTTSGALHLARRLNRPPEREAIRLDLACAQLLDARDVDSAQRERLEPGGDVAGEQLVVDDPGRARRERDGGGRRHGRFAALPRERRARIAVPSCATGTLAIRPVRSGIEPVQAGCPRRAPCPTNTRPPTPPSPTLPRSRSSFASYPSTYPPTPQLPGSSSQPPNLLTNHYGRTTFPDARHAPNLGSSARGRRGEVMGRVRSDGLRHAPRSSWPASRYPARRLSRGTGRRQRRRRRARSDRRRRRPSSRSAGCTMWRSVRSPSGCWLRSPLFVPRPRGFATVLETDFRLLDRANHRDRRRAMVSGRIASGRRTPKTTPPRSKVRRTISERLSMVRGTTTSIVSFG